MATEACIEAANAEMASIADIEASTHERRERLRAIWQPIIDALADSSLTTPERVGSDPYYAGLTCDTRRPVFLEKETSPGGFVYRKFVVRQS